MKLELVRAEELSDNGRVEVAEVEDSDFALHADNVVDNLLGAALADSKLVLVGAELVYQLDKALDREGIVLGGDAELLFALALAVALADILDLVVRLARVAHELHSVAGQRNASARA